MRPAAVKAFEVVLKTALRNPEFQAFIFSNGFTITLTTGTENRDDHDERREGQIIPVHAGRGGWKKKCESCRMKWRAPDETLGGMQEIS